MDRSIGRFGLILAAVVFALSAAALADTFSDTGLSGLKYRSTGTATSQYVANSPGYASLSTPDSGTTGDTAVVYVTNTMAPLGNLATFSGSFTYSNYSGPGALPYWAIYLSSNNCVDYPNSDCILILGMGGQTINGSSAIHVYDPAGNVSDYWGQTLSSIFNVSYNGTTLGNMPIFEAGVEIGDWNNGANVIPASVHINSITVSSVPEPASLLLLGTGLAAIAGALRRKLML